MPGVRLDMLAFGMLFWCSPLQAATLGLAEALQAAATNLEVSLAARAAHAAQADVVAADHAPLPQLSAKLSQMDLQNGIGGGNLLRDKRIDKGLGLDWTWERGDKRLLRTETARRAAAAAWADLDEVRVQQALAATAAFYELLAAQGRIDEFMAIERSANATAEVARKRLDAGDVSTQDLARAGIDAERARSDVETAQLDRVRAQLALAQITGLEADAESLQVQAEWPLAAAVENPSLPTLAVEQRADVRAAAERVLAAEGALSSAQAQRHSDITWGTSIDHYPGTSTRQLELRLSMPLTWGYHYEGESAKAQAQLAQARDQLDKTRRLAAAELHRLQAEASAAARRAGRFEHEIVPRSREVAERAELAYRKGALPLSEVLDARRTLRTVLLDALSARVDFAKALGAWQLRSNPSQATASPPR